MKAAAALLRHVAGRLAGVAYGVAGALLDQHSRSDCDYCRRELRRSLTRESLTREELERELTR